MEHALSAFLIVLAGAVGFQVGRIPGLIAGQTVIHATLWLLHRPKGGY